MKSIFTIMKKELSRVFKDKRLVFSTILMPGILIYIMYSFMGKAITSVFSPSTEQPYEIVNVGDNINDTQLIQHMLTENNVNFNFIKIDKSLLEQYKEKLLNGDVDYIIEFDNDFYNSIALDLIPNVNTYYNPGEEKSNNINTIINSIFQILSDDYLKVKYGDFVPFTINKENQESKISNEDKVVAKAIAMVLPFLIIIFLFAGAMSVGPESISGDKERGTMATLLATPINRRDIALGKVFSLSIVSVLSALSSFIGIISSLPKLMGVSADVDITNIYKFKDYIFIFIILLVTVLLIVGMISVVSAIAKNMKEASTYILPLYFLSMAVGIVSMFSTSAQSKWYLYLIPMYGSLQGLISIFTFDFNILNFLVIISSCVIYTTLLIYLLTKLFNNEKVMFAK